MADGMVSIIEAESAMEAEVARAEAEAEALDEPEGEVENSFAIRRESREILCQQSYNCCKLK